MSNYKNWKERRADELGVNLSPDQWFYLDHPTHADWYSLDTALKYADAAETAGVDPFDYVALGISESGLGNKDPGNPSRVFWNKHPGLMEALSPTGMMPNEADARKLSIDFGAQYLAEQMNKYPDDRLKALQAYSGLGKTIYGGHPDVVQYMTDSLRSFGKPYQKINYAKDKPQAKRIAGLSELLKTTPELVSNIFSRPISGMLQGKTNQIDRSNWPLRVDGTPKGSGWLGVLPMKNGQVVSEATIGVSFDGKDVLIPSLVPTLLPDEVNYILGQKKLSPEMWKTPMGESIVNKAVEHAKKRIKEGKSPFIDEGQTTPLARSDNKKAVLIGESGIGNPFVESLLQYLGQTSR